MEPVTHFLTGACIGRAGLNRKTAYATLAAVLAAEAADLDISGDSPGRSRSSSTIAASRILSGRCRWSPALSWVRCGSSIDGACAKRGTRLPHPCHPSRRMIRVGWRNPHQLWLLRSSLRASPSTGAGSIWPHSSPPSAICFSTGPTTTACAPSSRSMRTGMRAASCSSPSRSCGCCFSWHSSCRGCSDWPIARSARGASGFAAAAGPSSPSPECCSSAAGDGPSMRGRWRCSRTRMWPPSRSAHGRRALPRQSLSLARDS